MKKTLIIIGAIVLVAVIIFASVKGGGSRGESVYVEPVTLRNIQAIVTAPGEVDPKVKVNISAHIVGKIEKIYFNEGVNQAQALLQQAQTDLDHTTILSPITGKAVQLNAHEGEVVITGTMNNPGSVIAVIADLSEILVEADVGETEITGIRLNEPSKVHVDAIPDKEYAGHVAEIGSSAALKQGTGAGMRYFKVKVQFDNPDDRLRPGMTAQVSISTTTSGSALSVPIQSVVERVPPALAKS